MKSYITESNLTFQMISLRNPQGFPNPWTLQNPWPLPLPITAPLNVLPHSNARRRGVYTHHHPPLNVLPRSNTRWRGAYAHHLPPLNVLPCLNARQRGAYAHHLPPLNMLPRSNVRRRGSLCPPLSFRHAPSLERETEGSLCPPPPSSRRAPSLELETEGSLCPPPPSFRHAPLLEHETEELMPTTLLSTCSFTWTRDRGAYAHHPPFNMLPHSNARWRGVYAHHPPFNMLPHSNTRWGEFMPTTTFLSTCSLTRMRCGGELWGSLCPPPPPLTCSLAWMWDGACCSEFDTRRRNPLSPPLPLISMPPLLWISTPGGGPLLHLWPSLARSNASGIFWFFMFQSDP